MVKGILLDISGVLYQDDEPLPGAVEAVRKLVRAGIALRLVTNTSRRTSEAIYYDLKRMGFGISREHLYTAPRAILDYLQQHSLRPYCLIHPGLEPEFAHLDHTNPNAVVVCDAGDFFNYRTLNNAFQILIKGNAELLAVGDNRYFRSHGRLQLDAGPFVKALEHASGKKALILGKPAAAFFEEAVQSMGLRASDVVMIGDDVDADVNGAIDAGLSACLVKSGKYCKGDENRAPAAGLAESLADFVDRHF